MPRWTALTPAVASRGVITPIAVCLRIPEYNWLLGQVSHCAVLWDRIAIRAHPQQVSFLAPVASSV
jgi:hypothetical protein